MLPHPVLATLAGAADNAGKMPLTDFCNRPSARAPMDPLDSHAVSTRRLAASPAQVGGRLTPSSQLQPSPRRPSCEGERRTGTALPCGGLFGRSQGSELDLWRLVTLRCVPREQVAPESLGRLRRAPVKEPSLGHAIGIRLRVSLPRGAPDPLAQILHATRSRLPSTGALSWPAFACPFENPPPSSRRCRLRAGFVRSSLSRPLGALARGSVSSARRPSTSAITTVPEHDSGRDLPPRRPRRDRFRYPAWHFAGCRTRLAARGRSISLRPRGRRTPCGAASTSPCEGSFAPTPRISGTSCHRARVRTGRRACADRRDQGPHELAGGRRKRHPLEGCFSSLPRRRDGWAHPRCLPSSGHPLGVVRTHSTACDQPVEYLRRRLFYRRDFLRH